MTEELKKLTESLDYIRSITDFEPEIAIVLGSGLGAIADSVDEAIVIPFSKIPNFPVSTTSGHSGELHLGWIGGVKVILFKGRVHLYEDYTIEEVVRPIRLASLLGATKIIITNSAGAINTTFEVGDKILISDHISSFVPSPIRGNFRKEFGIKLDFPDMSEVYDRQMKSVLRDVASRCGTTMKEGVYLQVAGAQYETPAEIRFYRSIGADLVGMSSVIEAISARHAGMKVCAISTVTNMASGIEKKELTHEEVKEVGKIASQTLGVIIKQSLEEIRNLK